MTQQRPVPPGLKPFWSGSVQKFAELQPNGLSPEDEERCRIYSLMLMSLLVSKWNGNKYGETGDYGVWREEQQIGTTKSGLKVYGGGSYLGHNIAAVAVDAEGRIIDFDFNHNAVFDSTVEHAESRLVRRVFALNQIYDPWFALNEDGSTPANAEGARHGRRRRARRNVFATEGATPPVAPPEKVEEALEAKPEAPVPYSTLLTDVTIFTSLESCAQCSGIMCLGSVKDIVYLQWDQGQFLVGNMMWQATTTEKMGFTAPRPIRGDEIGLKQFQELNEANERFEAAVPQKPFYVGPGSGNKPVTSPAVTSFLCTDPARQIYKAAAKELTEFELNFPSYQPIPTALTNEEAVIEANDFVEWAGELESRGAPHRV
jgi:tRNA(Arg) A34 adenosine deaminase TadA